MWKRERAGTARSLAKDVCRGEKTGKGGNKHRKARKGQCVIAAAKSLASLLPLRVLDQAKAGYRCQSVAIAAGLRKPAASPAPVRRCSAPARMCVYLQLCQLVDTGNRAGGCVTSPHPRLRLVSPACPKCTSIVIRDRAFQIPDYARFPRSTNRQTGKRYELIPQG